MDIRFLENTKKFGYAFFITYEGSKFSSFDENTDRKTVKSEIKRILEELGVSWAKGLQQSARTDAKVNAEENIIYISSNFNGDIEELKEKINKKAKGLKIIKIIKVLPDLIAPELIKRRIYHYKYPINKLNKKEDEIKKTCLELSGIKDFSEFTDYKGKQLKNKIRDVNITYENGVLVFDGESFLPKQVRIMSSYILSGENKIFPAKYLTLKKLILIDEFENYIFNKEETLSIEGVKKIEKIEDVFIFYVNKENKGEVIGKRGKNIKKLRKEYGKVVIKDV